MSYINKRRFSYTKGKSEEINETRDANNICDRLNKIKEILYDNKIKSKNLVISNIIKDSNDEDLNILGNIIFNDISNYNFLIENINSNITKDNKIYNVIKNIKFNDLVFYFKILDDIINEKINVNNETIKRYYEKISDIPKTKLYIFYETISDYSKLLNMLNKYNIITEKLDTIKKLIDYVEKNKYLVYRYYVNLAYINICEDGNLDFIKNLESEVCKVLKILRSNVINNDFDKIKNLEGLKDMLYHNDIYKKYKTSKSIINKIVLFIEEEYNMLQKKLDNILKYYTKTLISNFDAFLFSVKLHSFFSKQNFDYKKVIREFNNLNKEEEKIEYINSKLENDIIFNKFLEYLKSIDSEKDLTIINKGKYLYETHKDKNRLKIKVYLDYLDIFIDRCNYTDEFIKNKDQYVEYSEYLLNRMVNNFYNYIIN